MLPCRLCFALLLILAGRPAYAQSRSPMAKPAVSPASAVLDLVPAKHREDVAKVMTKPTLTAKYTEEPFQAHAAIYPWLLEHPDRVSLAWQRSDVACVEIKDAGNGSFTWSDPDGSQLTWQAVAKLTDGVVWYATGKVKAAVLLPMISVKAVAVVKYPSKATEQKGVVTLTPEATVYLHSDSRAANAVLRMAGPAAPKMAEEGAEQLLFFFSGIATQIKEHPEKAQTLLAAKKK